MSKLNHTTSTLACTSAMIAGTVMLSCSAPAHAGREDFREFRQLNAGISGRALKALWRQQNPGSPVTIQPIFPGADSNGSAPVISGLSIQPMPTGGGINSAAPVIGGLSIQPMPTGSGINGDAPPISSLSIQPTTTSGGVNGDALPLGSGGLSIQPIKSGAGTNNNAPQIKARNGVSSSDGLSIQPIPTGAGSNGDAPPIPTDNTRHSRNNRSSQLQQGSRVAVNGIDIDLGSVDQNIRLGNRLFNGVQSVTIDVGGGAKTLTPGSQVTAAEYLAVRQVLSGQAQELVLNDSGSAIGGRVDFSHVSSRNERVKVDDMTIPVNVSVFGDFSKTPLFAVKGDLINEGNLYAYASGGNARNGAISADNVMNSSSGLISSLPNSNASAARSDRPVDLNIHADDSFSNFGTISSSGNLLLSAGNQASNGKTGVISAQGSLSINAPKINNAGLISSVGGNVTLDGPSSAVLEVTNSSGTIRALNGAINVRDASYNGVFNTYVSGGNLLSNAVNVNAGQGSAEIDVEELTGTLNQTGAASHVAAQTSTLKLGNICLTGDPTYSNSAGDISLDGNIVVGEALSIIASGDINASVPLTITANSVTQGFDVTLVAGAQITAGGTTTNVGPIPPLPATVITTISGNPSATGGNINFGVNGAVNINTSPSGKTAANGGNVTLAAFSSGGLNGAIRYTLGTITTSGKGTGTNGNVSILAGSGATSAFENSISTINASGGTGGGGNVTYIGAQPFSAAAITYANDGSASGTLTTTGAVTSAINTVVRGQITAAGNVAISSGSLSWVSGSKVGISNSTTSGKIDLITNSGNGIVIGSKNIFSTNTLTLNAGTGNIGQGGVIALQTNAAKIVANGDANLSEIVVVSSNSGLVLFNGAANILNLSCAGTFMTDPSLAPITANTALIGSFKAGTGLNSFNPVEVAADNLFITASSKGDVFAHNSNATTTTLIDTGSMIANKTFSLFSDNGLSMQSTAFINADNVILNTSGNFGSLGGTIDGDVSVSLTMNGDLTNANIPASVITPLLKLASTSGSIGTSTAARYTVNTGALAVTATTNAAGKGVFLQGPVAKTFKIVGGSAKGTFDYLGPGSVIISGSVNSGVNADLNIVIATGSLTTAASTQLHAGQDMLLQVADTVSTKIKIVLGLNTDIFTDSTSTGNIDIALGNINPVAGTPPAKGVSFAEFGAGADIFWGAAGISGKNQNFVIAQGADVTFSNSISSKAISLAGGVQITADPPIVGSQTAVGGSPSGRLNSGLAGFSALNTDTASGAQALAISSDSSGQARSTGSNFTFDSSPSFAQEPASPGALLHMAGLTDAASSASNIAQANINIVTATQAAIAARDAGSDDETYLISSGPSSNFCVGSLCAEPQMYEAITSDQPSSAVIRTNVPHVALQKKVSLRSGKTMFVPNEDMIVQTPLGDVELQAGSVTIVSANDTSVALFNVHDSSKDSVSMVVDGKKLSISPGRHILVTREKGNDFAATNHIETIQHRAVNTRALGKSLTLHSSEFSTLSAMDSVLPLRAVCSSKHPNSKKLAQKMLKTTAVIMQLSGNGDYQHYVKPRLTALASL